MAQTQAQIFKTAGRKIRQALVKELQAQGHTLTGALENSIQPRLVRTGNVTELQIVMNTYGFILDKGVTAARVPFRAGSKAGHSRYIEALTEYWQQRGLGAKEAQRAAFATAMVQKRQGMPTIGSYRYTKTGQRKNFVARALDRTGPQVQAIIAETTKDMKQLILDTFRKTKSEVI